MVMGPWAGPTPMMSSLGNQVQCPALAPAAVGVVKLQSRLWVGGPPGFLTVQSHHAVPSRAPLSFFTGKWSLTSAIQGLPPVFCRSNTECASCLSNLIAFSIKRG